MDKPFVLSLVQSTVAECRKCQLCETRTQTVFGEGNPDAEVMFLGEGPGREEDEQGRPFVGRAGKLLDVWIESLGLLRSDVYIANIVKCRPPNNRNPENEEVEACIGYLKEQIKVIKPKAIVLLGSVALKAMFGDKKASIMRERGIWKEYEGIPVMPTFHPAFLLRQMSEDNKNRVKRDLAQIKERNDEVLS